MSLAIIHSRASLGLQAPAVTIEVHISNGLPGFSMVGLPDTAVKESKERVRSAIINSEFEFPLDRTSFIIGGLPVVDDGQRKLWGLRGKLYDFSLDPNEGCTDCIV